jgi:hypothetical protein
LVADGLRLGGEYVQEKIKITLTQTIKIEIASESETIKIIKK